MIKSTYGTGCFALLNTGTTPVASKNKLLTTIAYQLDGKRTYALEGSIFVAGSSVQWLRDGLGIIKQAAQDRPARRPVRFHADRSIWCRPLSAWGAPYWNPRVRGALFGLTRNTGPAELAHAALESVCYQTFDLWAAMRADWPDAKAANTVLRVDGGMTGVRLDHAAPRRPARRAGRSPDDPGNHRAWAPPISPGSRPASIPSPQNSPTTGGWSTASSRT